MSARACSAVLSRPCWLRACSCAIATISSSLRLRTSNPQGQRKLRSRVTCSVLPRIPVRIHPHVDIGLSFEELAEEFLDLRRTCEALDPLEAGPFIDAEESLGVAGIQEDTVREIAGLLRRVLGRPGHLVVVFLRVDKVL